MADWNVQSVQMVWFTDAITRGNFEETFATLVGLEATTSQTTKLVAPQVGTTGFAQATAESLTYTLQFNPGRFDLFVLGEEGPFGAIRPDIDVPAIVKGVIDRGHVPGLARLSVLVNVVSRAANVQEANAVLRGKLGCEIPTDGDMDFRLQVNRRFEVEGQGCNRIGTWAVSQYQDIVVQLPSGPLAPPASPPKVMVSVGFDLNTLPASRPFSDTMYKAIFNGLADEAFRLSRENSLEAFQ